MVGHHALKVCDECGRKLRNLNNFHGKFICGRCKLKLDDIIPYSNGRKPITIDKALEKVYEIKGRTYMNKKGKPVIATNNISLPSILIGHKIKFILADDETEN